MRRAQVDRASQAVRNLFTNPSCETGSATQQVIRTNMCQHPSMSLASGTVTTRQNLAVNPNAALSTGWFPANGMAATLTTNVAGGPTGPFARLTATATATGNGYFAPAYGQPGAGNGAAVTAGATYTLSGYVRVTLAGGMTQQPVIRLRWKDSAGTTLSDITVTAVGATNGSWIRLSATGVAPASAAYIEAMGGYGSINMATVAIGDTADFTGVLIEQSGYLDAFFTGSTAAAGDFTYSWSGAANASVSNQIAPGVSGWTAQWYGNQGGTGVTFQSSDTPIDGPFMRKLWKTANTGGNADMGWRISTRINVTAGVVYTMSATFRSSVAQHISLFPVWYDAGGAVISTGSQSDLGALVPNTWTRFGLTLPAAPAGAVTAYFNVGTGAGAIAMPAGSTFDVDQVLIENAASIGPFFSGNYPAADDFVYVWTGTVNASSSQQKATVGVNMGGVGVVPVKSINWSVSGGSSVRMVPVAVGPSTDNFMAPGGDTGAMRNGMESGKTYTFMAALRQNTVLAGSLRTTTPVQLYAYWRVGAGSYTAKTIPGKVNAVGIEIHRLTFTLPAGCTEAFVRVYHGGIMNAGDVYVDNIMLVEGEYLGDYIDPDRNLLARWDGASHASTSIGYPPQLLDIAGKPSIDISTGTTGPLTVADPYAARTIYVCYDIWGATQSYPVVGTYGIGNSNGLNFQMGPLATTYATPRLDIPGGSSNYGPSHPNGRMTRAHVLAYAFNQGLTNMTSCLNGGADKTSALTPGNGLVDGRATIGSNPDGKGLRMLVFYAEHDAATRLAISRYLGNKYGAAVS